MRYLNGSNKEREKEDGERRRKEGKEEGGGKGEREGREERKGGEL